MTHLLVEPVTTLQRGALGVVLAPSAGGRISRLFSVDAATGLTIDWLVPFGDDVCVSGFESTAWPKAGLYPLVPFSNRIAQGRFTMADRDVQLPVHPGENHALHGGSQQQPWSLTEQSLHSATMTYAQPKNASGDASGWPWSYLAEHTVTLNEDGMTVFLSMRVTNTDEVAMPCGAGFHPYFPSRFAHCVGFDAATVWSPDSQFLGTAPQPVGVTDNYVVPRELADVELTQYYGGWDGHASLRAADGAVMRMTGNGALQHLVLYRPKGREFFCVEPVSHVSNAANLAKSHAGTGWQTLAPGQSLECVLQLQLLAG